MNRQIIALISAALLISCGNDSSSGSGSTTTTELYILNSNSGVTCINHNAKINNVSYVEGNKLEMIACSWACISYNGKQNQVVALVFSRSSKDNIWKFSSETVMDGFGIC
jgi:hypothetical protein